MKILKALHQSAVFWLGLLTMPKATADDMPSDTEVPGLVVLPLRGVENCWFDYYLAVRYSAVTDTLVVMMRQDFLPTGTFENHGTSRSRYRLLFNRLFVFLTCLILKVRNVKYHMISDPLDTETNGSLHQDAFDSYSRRYFGCRDILDDAIGQSIKTQFSKIFNHKIGFDAPSVVLVSSHHIYEWQAVIDNFERNFNVQAKVCWGRNVYNENIMSVSDRPLQIGQTIGYAHPLPENFFSLRSNAKSTDQKWQVEDTLPEDLEAFVAKYEKCMVLAPNCIWDGDINERDSFLNGVEEFVTTCCEIADQSATTGLIIRFHPAEATLWKSRPSLAAKVLPQLEQYKNIFYIQPEQKISTLALIRRCGNLLIYSGMLALEGAVAGFNVFCASNSIHSKVAGVTRLDTKDELAALFKTAADLDAVKTNKRNDDSLSVEDVLSSGLEIEHRLAAVDFATLPSLKGFAQQREIDRFFDDLILDKIRRDGKEGHE